MKGPVGPAAAAYAAKLSWAVKRHTATGGTQSKMAESIHIAASTLSRYMSGERLAPRETLHAIRAFLEAQSPLLSFPEGFWEELDVLCGEAHRASETPSVKVAYLEGELGRAEERLRDLERERGEALARAQGAENARVFLQARVTEQDRSLRTARDYIQRIEAELAKYKERADLLEREVDVLREQNRRLIEAAPAVPAPSTQVSQPGHIYATEHTHPAPQPGFTPAPAGTEGTETGPVRWQAPPPEPPSPEPEPWAVQDQPECGHWSPDNFTYDETFRHYAAAATQIAWFVAQPGYQEDTVADPYPDAWAADAPYGACGYGEGWTAGPLHVPVAKEPPPTTTPAPPAPQKEEDEEVLQRTSCIRRSYAPPLDRTGLMLPDTAFLLLTLLVTALMCATAAAVTKLAGTRWGREPVADPLVAPPTRTADSGSTTHMRKHSNGEQHPHLRYPGQQRRPCHGPLSAG
ncbi:hypothetical protein [Streptomyces sp. NBC_01565]|uniref:hypothetical protein n=1 Tax=unclassified Streptomyces TaxID=2593676 RepID=UPI0022514330|nr:hypothetical protein [Streptomyces sp. NBC_01565]MCX4546862.1 hypothetical protein [Streptomyces sp. NBC_01565]